MHQHRPRLVPVRRGVVGLVAALALAGAGPGTAHAGLVIPTGGTKPRPTPRTLPTNTEIFEHIKNLTANGPRRIGTDASDKAANYVADHLRDYGMTGVTTIDTPSYSWDSLGHSLSIAGYDIDAFPSAYSQSAAGDWTGVRSTPAGGLKAPVVDIGTGGANAIKKQDVRGKIVVFDLRFTLPLAALILDTEYLYDPRGTLLKSPQTLAQANPYITTYESVIRAAQDGGAAGFVGVLGDYFESNKYFNEFYRKLTVTIPGMWVSPAEGQRVRALVAGTGGREMTMNLSTRREKVNAHTVYGYLEGKSKDTVMVHSHHDSVWEGAVEDGSGTAEVLALAKHYSAQPAGSREKTLMFITTDSHFSGYQAHIAFTRDRIVRRDPGTEPHRIVADVTLEHIGKSALIGKDGSLQVSDLPEPRGVFANVNPALKNKLAGAIKRNNLERTVILNANPLQFVGIPTDASAFVRAGIPTISLIAGPIYLYDEADRLDLVAVDQLQPVAKAFSEVIDDLDAANSETIGAVPYGISSALGKSSFEAMLK